MRKPDDVYDYYDATLEWLCNAADGIKLAPIDTILIVVERGSPVFSELCDALKMHPPAGDNIRCVFARDAFIELLPNVAEEIADIFMSADECEGYPCLISCEEGFLGCVAMRGGKINSRGGRA